MQPVNQHVFSIFCAFYCQGAPPLFGCLCPLSHSIVRASLCITVWHGVRQTAACVSLSAASSASIVSPSESRIRQPQGQQRSRRVQLVRLCLDRLSQTYSLLPTAYPLTHRHIHTHICTIRGTTTTKTSLDKSNMCAINNSQLSFHCTSNAI